MFSPYYAWAGRRDPDDHCALNVALYGQPGARWAMTERRRTAVSRSADRLVIGPSAVQWQDGTLTIAVAERGAPIPRRLAGTITATPLALPRRRFALDPAGRHHWQPIAPKTRVSVRMSDPALSWDGDGYLDANWGAEPLEAGFRDWTWARGHRPGESLVLYDAQPRGGQPRSQMALRIADDGSITALTPPSAANLPTTFWRIPRAVGADPGSAPRVLATWEDTPFYARSRIKTTVLGHDIETVHESLDLDRFASPLVRLMLPFRMPRR